MSHLIDRSNRRDNIAFVGEVPWHGLGHAPENPDDIDSWITAAGLGHEVRKAPAYMHLTDAEGKETGEVRAMRNVCGLYRTDTGAHLGHVSDSHYKIVQPRECVEFFRDLVKDKGFTLDVAGSLKGGKRVWALARAPQDLVIGGGKSPDIIRPYLLFSTTYDNQRATQAQFTGIRVVCNNTISMAYQEFDAAIREDRQIEGATKMQLRALCKELGIARYSDMNNEEMRNAILAKDAAAADRVPKGKPKFYVQIPHSRKLNIPQVHEQLGLVMKAAEQFGELAEELAKRKVSDQEAAEYVISLFGKRDKEQQLTDQSKAVIAGVVEAVKHSPGSHLATADGTAWGLLNGVTHFLDFKTRARSDDNRLNNAWFSDAARLKLKALAAAKQLIAA